MSSGKIFAERPLALLATLLLMGSMVAQPLCDVLLRPAFNYSTDGLSLIISDSSSTYGVPTERSWTFGDGSAASTSPAHVYPAPGEYQVCLTLIASSIQCATTYCRRVTVPLNDCDGQIDALFTWGNAGTNSQQLVDASVLAGASARLWEFGDGATSTEPIPVHTWLLPGPHFVSLTRTQGACTATYGTWVEVDGNATTCGPGFFVDFNTYPFGNTVSFEPSITPNNAIPLGSIWSYGDGDMDTTATGMHTYANEGPYQACLLVGAVIPPALDSCFTLVCRTFSTIPLTGLEEATSDPITVAPNPFSTELRVTLPSAPGVPRLRVLDMTGRDLGVPVVSHLGEVLLQVQGLPQGVYLLEVRQGPGLWYRRVVKAHE